MNDIFVTVLGHVGTPPRSAVTRNGQSVTSFRLGSTPRHFDRQSGGWADGPTNWFTVTCWRQLADHVTSCVGMGQPLIVHGRLRSKTYTKGDGTSAVSYEIDAVTVGHDMSRGTSMFERREPERRERTAEVDTTAEDLARTVTEEAEEIVAGAAVEGTSTADPAAA